MEMIIGSIFGRLSTLLDEELIIVLGVDNQVEWLQGQLRLMQSFLQVADSKNEAIVKTWVAEIRDLVYDAEDILDTLSINTRRQQTRWYGCFNFFIMSINIVVLRKVGIGIRQIKTKMDDLSRNRSAFDIEYYLQRESLMNANGPRLRERRRSFPEHGEPTYIVDLEEDAGELKGRLFGRNGGRVISIVGIAGLGKTTLAIKVYHDPLVRDHFHQSCAWVYVSQEYKCQELLQEIERQLMGVSHVQMTEAYLKMKLSEFLKSRRYLVVMDDVWNTEVWDDLKAAFPDTGNGSKIILTTRNCRVALHADPRSPPHEPRLLNDQHSWELLAKKVFLEASNCPPNLEEKGGEIARKCGGLPLAITEVGELLARRDPSFSAWSQVHDHVNWYLSQDNTSFSDTLAMSYDELPYHLKQCFLYFGIFPKGFQIPVRRLIGLWVAEGLVQQQQQHQQDQQQHPQQQPQIDGKPPEDIVDDYIKELINRNMVEVVRKRSDGRPKSCRIPGILYDLCLSKAADVNLFHLHPNATVPVSSSTYPTRGKVRRLAYNFDIKTYPSSEPYIRHLRSFISFDFREGYVPGEEIGSFLSRGFLPGGFWLLRVLDLERVFKPKLPESLGDLIHLRYLGLRWTFSDTLPSSVGNLWELQILDVKRTYIMIFPHSIWEMRQLRHLYLNEGHRSRFVHHPRGGSLASLQTLWGLFVDKESQVRNGLDTLTDLRKLGLTCQLTTDQKEEVAEWIATLDKLQSLRLRSRNETGEPSDLSLKPFSAHNDLRDLYLLGRLHNLFDVNEFPPKLTNLNLSLSELREDPMPTLESLPYLVYLRLLSNSYMGGKMVCSSRGFPQLLVLKLWNLMQLEEWEVEEGALPSLVELEIRYCTSLKMLPHGLQYVTTLKKLKVTHMPHEFVARVRAVEGEDWSKISHVISIQVESMPETEGRSSSSS